MPYITSWPPGGAVDQRARACTLIRDWHWLLEHTKDGGCGHRCDLSTFPFNMIDERLIILACIKKRQEWHVAKDVHRGSHYHFSDYDEYVMNESATRFGRTWSRMEQADDIDGTMTDIIHNNVHEYCYDRGMWEDWPSYLMRIVREVGGRRSYLYPRAREYLS